jgi:hypothetical protein
VLELSVGGQDTFVILADVGHLLCPFIQYVEPVVCQQKYGSRDEYYRGAVASCCMPLTFDLVAPGGRKRRLLNVHNSPIDHRSMKEGQDS